MSTSSASIDSAAPSSPTAGRPNATSTGAPATADRSVAMRACTSSVLSKRIALKELRYSLNDLDSTRFGESAGTTNVAVATTGLPRGSSHDSSYACQRSWPVNGSSAPSPSAARPSLRGIANSNPASYPRGYSTSRPSGNPDVVIPPLSPQFHRPVGAATAAIAFARAQAPEVLPGKGQRPRRARNSPRLFAQSSPPWRLLRRAWWLLRRVEIVEGELEHGAHAQVQGGLVEDEARGVVAGCSGRVGAG